MKYTIIINKKSWFSKETQRTAFSHLEAFKINLLTHKDKILYYSKCLHTCDGKKTANNHVDNLEAKMIWYVIGENTKHNFHNLLVHFRTLMINNWMGNLYWSDATSVVIIVVISVKYLTPIIKKNKHFYWRN